MLDQLESAIEDFAAGKIVIVVDDENRENEGDFVMAAEMATAEQINFMATHGRGLICAPVTQEIADQFDLQLMPTRNVDRFYTAFTQPVDARFGISTGISAADRGQTMSVLTDPNADADDLIQPGHVFPLLAKDGGVLERPGHTEAAIELCQLAEKKRVGVICEICNADGSMARLPQLREIADRFDLKICSIEQLIARRLQLNGRQVDPLPIGSNI
jgi:3,4-dihydroxy 2-butanone 4-phosphate synthase/GTP cyclohydrolase II